jgi:hypothetical protein
VAGKVIENQGFDDRPDSAKDSPALLRPAVVAHKRFKTMVELLLAVRKKGH